VATNHDQRVLQTVVEGVQHCGVLNVLARTEDQFGALHVDVLAGEEGEQVLLPFWFDEDL